MLAPRRGVPIQVSVSPILGQASLLTDIARCFPRAGAADVGHLWALAAVCGVMETRLHSLPG